MAILRIVCKDVLWSVPSAGNLSLANMLENSALPSKAKVQATHETDDVVDDAHFLMLRITKMSISVRLQSITHTCAQYNVPVCKCEGERWTMIFGCNDSSRCLA
jgi:hypothetical protein